MKYRIITIISFIGSAVISLLGGWDKSLQTLIIFMTIDWLTGGILLPVVFQKSPKSQNGALESHAGWKGLCRKAMTLFYVLVGAQLDSLMGTEYVRDAVCIGIYLQRGTFYHRKRRSHGHAPPRNPPKKHRRSKKREKRIEKAHL